MRDSDRQLPVEFADRLTAPLARFLRIHSAAGAALLLAASTAIALANSPWSESFLAIWETPVGLTIGTLDFTRSLRHWINEGLLTLFFFLVALELKRELSLGELRQWRMAVLPFAGSLGGMVVPVAVFLVVLGDADGAGGWGTVMATDTALVVGCMALLGKRLPPWLRVFLLSLAVFDDIGAILVVAVAYTESVSWGAFVLVVLGLVAVAVAARAGVRSVPVFAVLGVTIWFCAHASGIHPTVVGVVLGLMTPARPWVVDQRLNAILAHLLANPRGNAPSGEPRGRSDLVRAGIAINENLAPLERLEFGLHPWVGFLVMPLFALANAGVPVAAADMFAPVAFATFLGLVLGKPVGVIGFCWLAIRLGVARPMPAGQWPLLIGGSLLTGIGFTMSLFIAELAFAPTTVGSAKLGVLAASVTAASAGIAVLLTNGGFRPVDLRGR
ncbi:MAG: Na+/H+ antiporter NhaA [Pseudomonadota bacterium]